MFILFGIRVRLRTIEEGTFHCPHCGVDRIYRRRALRQWFTLFFIPVVPLRHIGEIVECTTCQERYDLSVLRLPTSNTIANELAAAMRAAVAAIAEAGDPHRAATRAAAVAVMADASMAEYVDATLTWDLDHHADVGHEDRLRRLATLLEPVGREHLLTQLAGIALADGDYTDEETRALDRAGGALGLSPAHVHGVLETARSARRTG